MAQTQNIYFDKDGYIVGSDEVLFPLSAIENYERVNEFPFIDSIFSIILSMPPAAPALRFPCVEPLSENLRGLYDYTFTRIQENGKDIYRWQLCDRTDFYRNKRAEQQSQQENQINKDFPE